MCEAGRTFTWFPKLTRVMQALPAENVAEFALAVTDYGTNGVEPSFSSPILAAVFEGVREDIDNSLNARYRNKGGRPKKNLSENGGSEVSETQETPVSENENPGVEVSENGNPSYISQTKPNQTIPIQSNPDQSKEREGKRERFHPPSVEEVRAHCAEKGYHLDAEAFVAFYESNGWKVGRHPMKSWKAACVTWDRRNAPRKEVANAYAEYD